VPKLIKRLSDDGYLICIFVNRIGLEIGTKEFKILQKTVLDLVLSVEKPVFCLIATKSGKY
jgi:pyruvate kinase